MISKEIMKLLDNRLDTMCGNRPEQIKRIRSCLSDPQSDTYVVLALCIEVMCDIMKELLEAGASNPAR